MGQFQGPNLLVLSRAARPPVAGLDRGMPKEDAARPVGVVGAGGKGVIRGKSLKSSLNLARVLSSLDWDRNGECLHLSLTYHRSWPRSKDALCAAKSQLVARLGEHVEAGLWMLEYQKRLVPHFHALVWMGGRSSEEFAGWLAGWWADFSENSSDFASRVTLGDQARGTWYLAMHAAKRNQTPPFAVGRWWGYIRRGRLLNAQDVHRTRDVSERERVWWSRLYRRSTGGKVRNAGGFTWFLPRAWQCVAGAWISERVVDEMTERFRPKNPF